MSDQTTTETRWQDWIEEACAAVGIDPDSVDVPAVHALTKAIAHGVERPLAPVGAYILGVAVGHLEEQGRPIDMDSLQRAIEATTIHHHEQE